MPVGRKPMNRKSPCRGTSMWKWRQLVSKDFCSSNCRQRHNLGYEDILETTVYEVGKDKVDSRCRNK
jgi:hypothetical protein